MENDPSLLIGAHGLPFLTRIPCAQRPKCRFISPTLPAGYLVEKQRPQFDHKKAPGLFRKSPGTHRITHFIHVGKKSRESDPLQLLFFPRFSDDRVVSS